MLSKRTSVFVFNFAAFAYLGLVCPFANAQTGTLVGTVNFSKQCISGLGVGIAYDGTNLWYSCYGESPDLHRADPKTGIVSASYNIAGGIGALAYDASRNALWAGWSRSPSSLGNVYLISLDASKNVTGSAVRFNTGTHPLVANLDDGLAYDAQDDTLYISDDGSTIVHHYDVNGNHLDDRAWIRSGVPGSCYNSGLGIGGQLLYQGSNGCSHVWVTNKVTNILQFDFSTIVASDPNFRDEDLECDTNTFSFLGKHVMWSKEAYAPMRAHAYEIPFNSCGVGGQPSPKIVGRMTGGGSVLSTGNRVTHGFELNCDVLASPNNLEINWAGNSFHLESVTRVTCINDPGVLQKPPSAPFNTLKGAGTGRLNGAVGASAEWTFVDAGEPGKDDSVKLQIKDAVGNVMLEVSGFLQNGNHQAH
jgi:hypothetical protein